MFLLEPQQTQFDLRWRMFGIPVRVHPIFWLVSVIMGWSALNDGFQYLLVWVVCVFVSILIHELGHVLMGQVFGAHGHIVLYAFGGLAVGSNALSKRWQRIAVLFAGPLAGFVFLGLILLGIQLADQETLPAYVEIVKLDLGIPLDGDLLGLEGLRHEELLRRVELLRQVGSLLVRPTVLQFAVVQLIYINLLWGLVNLLPVWPLDGGQISRDVCGWLIPDRGLNVSLGISLVVAGLLALHSVMAANGHPLFPFLRFGSNYTAIMFGLLALQSFQMLQQAREQRRWVDDHWHRDDWQR